MMRAHRHRLRHLRLDQRGTAAVEFAIIVPVFFSLLLSIVDIGRYMWTLNTIQFAIDEAARAGVVQGLSTTEVQNQVKTALAHLGTTTGAIEVTATPTSSTLSITAETTYGFLFPISSFVETATINLRTEMPK